MRKKKFNKWYTAEKFKWVRKNGEHYLDSIKLDNDYLYSDAVYPTKIKKEDLPDTFVYGRFYRHWSWLNCSGIKDLYFCPSKSTKESTKDDFLYISYDESINKEAIENHDYENENYDFLCYGHEILTVLNKTLELDEYKNTELYNLAVKCKEEYECRIKETEAYRHDRGW